MTDPALLGTGETARRLGVHENTVRNMVSDGRILPAQRIGSRQFLRFDPDEVERAWRSMNGRDHAEDDLPAGTVIGVLVTLRLPAGMRPDEAVREVGRGIDFGKPEIRLHFVLPPAPEEEELWLLTVFRQRCGSAAPHSGPWRS